MTTYKPLVQSDSIVAQLETTDALAVSQIDTATLNLTGNLHVTGNSSNLWHDDLSGRESVNAHDQYSHLKTGWDHEALGNQVNITINDANRTLTLTPTSNDVSYWIKGVEYPLATQNITWNDSEGVWFLKLTANGAESTQVHWEFDDTAAFVTSLYWDATNKSVVLWVPEFHSWVISQPMEEFIHETFGVRWASGLGCVINSGNTTINTANGVLWDQMQKFTITDDAGTGYHDQTLTPLTAPVLYRTGASGVWRKITATSNLCYVSATVPQVNTFNGTEWVWNPVGVAKYFAYWVVGSTASDEPIYLIPGQVDASTLADALVNNTWSDLSFGELPTQEHKVIARLILLRDVSSPYYTIEQLDDYRNVADEPTSGGGSGAGTSDHGSLTGLIDDDHTQYALADGTRAFTTNNSVGVVLVNTGNNTLGTNCASSVILSGENNTLNGSKSAVISGEYNTVNNNAVDSVIVGGYLNNIGTDYSTVVGGRSLTINGDYAAAVGGYNNTLSGNYSVLVGGQGSSVSGDTCSGIATYLSTVGGSLSCVIGGQSNVISANSTGSAIVGGRSGTVNGISSVILTGNTNNISNNTSNSAIVAGYSNGITNNNSAIICGASNNVSGVTSAIIGGNLNALSGTGSTILGGYSNNLSGNYSSILGGYENTLSASYAVAHGVNSDTPFWCQRTQAGGRIAVNGDVQYFEVTQHIQSSSNTAADLTLDGVDSANSTNKLVMPVNCMWQCRVWVAGQLNFATWGAYYAIHAALVTDVDGVTTPVHVSGSPGISVLGEGDAAFNCAFAVRAGNVITVSVVGPATVVAPRTYNWVARWEILQIKVQS